MSELWAVHVLGPDDIVAAPSLEAAEKAAALVRARYSGKGEDCLISAVTVSWQGSAETHAREVAEFVEYFGDWDNA